MPDTELTSIPPHVGCPHCPTLTKEIYELRRQADEVPAGDSRYHALLREMGELHARKSADYGMDGDPFANVRGSADYGVPPWIGTMLRANDKVQRIKAYIKNGSLVNEGVEDSLLDLAAYALIALVLFREEQAKSRQ